MTVSTSLRLWGWCGKLLKWLLVAAVVLALAATALFAWYVLWPVQGLPELEPVDDVVYFDQGWGLTRSAPDRERYYYTPQGTSMPQGATSAAIRYDWFVNLRLPFSDQRFADPDHLRQYRFLVDPAATEANPDQLPVGFTKHFDPVTGDELLDITCAACHTGELHYTQGDRRLALRVDGGQAMHAISDTSRGSFAPKLVASLFYTAANPLKFDEFARDVLGTRYPQGKAALKDKLWATLARFAGSPQNNPFGHLYPREEGFGRTDALGRIGNTVFGDHLVPANYQVSSAPVSYPFLWDIWRFSWVQYNGSVSQPLARNVGEAMGVGARIPLLNDTGGPLPADERFRSSVRITDLHAIEQTLQTLQPPTWPEDVFGPVDPELAQQGGELFVQHCQGCHGPHRVSEARQQALAPLKPSSQGEWRIEVIPVEHIGTDPATAAGFMDRRYDLSAAGLTDQDLQQALEPLLNRQLVRQVRYRLREVIRLRQAQDLPVGDLPALLAAYPTSSPEARVPAAQFAAIHQALQAVAAPLPAIPDVRTPAPDPLRCDLQCQTVALLWQLVHGQDAAAITLDGLDVTRLTEGAALNLVGILVKNRYYQDHNLGYEQQQCLEGFGTLDLPQQILGYKPRPLAGVWATPPFLHNGSVPSIYQLLSPPETRSERFLVGSREYDPVHLGYRLVTAADAPEDARGFWLDTSLSGNRNTGHGFAADPAIWAQHQADPQAHPLPGGVIGPVLTHNQRLALLEYLKVHQDQPTADYEVTPASCQIAQARP
ncbi:di-heme-cytochrome C peroxidase [Marinobacter sp. SS21]|uniref:di-heme-cytochrome C peroxidase n=1 Tax=Marinobacter sp. SS21 TaxID=2979460 RepID=UPI00232C20BB|nr:di-heme-cytochrome C peroxidase [Marinobacter sp. SS21]MDC0664116.1 di-heme-cytochrome C peroxidase [Marinobacter sp. SS21]